MLKPALPITLTEACLEDAIADAMAAGEDIAARHFFGEALPALPREICEFTGCHFEKCSFSPCQASRLTFVDCVLDRCDLSSMDFQKATFQRVTFLHCRMTGASFPQATLMNVTFDQCQMDYCNFTEAKAQHAAFSCCALKESGFVDFRWRSVIFDRCNLQSSEWLHTPMKGLNLVSNQIEGIAVELPALRGLTVTADQALVLSGLLGLKVVSSPDTISSETT